MVLNIALPFNKKGALETRCIIRYLLGIENHSRLH
jgi:hypothetical protein